MIELKCGDIGRDPQILLEARAAASIGALKIAEAIPALLPHHPAWLARLAGTFDSALGWRLAPEAPALLRRLRERGIRGVSVFRGIEGFGRSSRVHTTRILALSEDLPILVEVVDEETRLRPVLDELEPMIGGGLVTLERVQVLVYRAGPGADAAS